jgi:predicted metal-dependent peptidase
MGLYRKLTLYELLIKERLILLDKYPFFGYLALCLELVETPELPIPTMATDGKHLFFHPDFVKNTSSGQLRGTIAHELLHCAFQHLWRRGKREKMKWNYATDFAINLIVTKEGLEIPPNFLLDKKYEGMSAEKIYDLLPDPKTIKGDLVCSHDSWPEKPDKNKEVEQQLKDSPEKSGNKDKKEINPSSSSNENMEERWKDRLLKAAHEARKRGNLPGQVKSMIDDLIEPKLDWKIILRDKVISTVKNDFRFFPPAKKYLWQGIYLPSSHGERLEVAIGVDTSGSVDKKQFQEFMAKMRGITEQFEDYILHIFMCDTRVHDYIVIDSQSNWPKSFPKHDGGTSFGPVVDSIAQKDLMISALVYLTDGEGSFPDREPEYPVIWILNKDSAVPWGTKIVM